MSDTLIVEFLYDLQRAFVQERQLGKVMRAPLPIRLWPGQMREPDLFFLRPERTPSDPFLTLLKREILCILAFRENGNAPRPALSGGIYFR